MFPLACCGFRRGDYEPISSEKSLKTDLASGYSTTGPLGSDDPEALANEAVLAFLAGNYAPIRRINARLSSSGVHATSWASMLAEKILSKLIDALQSDNPIGDAIRGVYDRVRDAALQAFEFAKEHPVFTAIVALGILCLIAPWVVGVLGFSEEGVIAGSWAARWQATYGGIIDEDSLFAWLQSFGARYG